MELLQQVVHSKTIKDNLTVRKDKSIFGMKKISKGLIIALGLVPAVGFAQKTVTIDVKSNVHTISPYIFGTNESYEGATAARWGGNRSTSYNWETNVSNGGNDFNFTSDNFYDYSGSNVPALPIVNAVQSADSKGQYSLVSLQAAGYVAADKDGAVTEEEVAPSARWKAISFHKDTEKSPYTMAPDLTDDTVYVDELINYLTNRLGRAGDGGVSAYAIDNEPYLWNQTHARLHPNQTTPDELFAKTIDLSSVIRRLAPGTDILGPMFFGYTDAYHWGRLDRDDAWRAIEAKCTTPDKKYNWFVDYYLDTLRKVEEASGLRPIDAIAFHWYPEAYGPSTKKRIVNVDGGARADEDLILPDMIETRLQAPRALWDTKYEYCGENGNKGGKGKRRSDTVSYVCLYDGDAIIKKIKKSIDDFYPGMKLAFTEFEYGAEDHWSGGLCLVDVLGVFGKEDVYLACKWNQFKSYSISAYNLYLNYDGAGSQFGFTSVSAVQSDTARLSSFASLDENKNLHIIVVNKSGNPQSVDFNINNGLYSDGVVYGFGEFSSEIQKLGTISKIENSSFTYPLPAHSAVHIILNAIPQTEIVKATMKNAENEIALTFADEVALVSADDVKNEFSIVADSKECEIASVEVSGKEAIVKLTENLSAESRNVLISYNGANLTGLSNLPVAYFDTVYVYNELPEAPMYALSSEIDVFGRYVKLSMSKPVGEIEDINCISIKQNDEIIPIKNYEMKEDAPYDLYVYTSSRIFKFEKTSISAETSSGVKSKDGASIYEFSFQQEGGANYTPNIDSAYVSDNYSVNFFFNANIKQDLDYKACGLILKDSDGVEYDYTSEYFKNIRKVVLTTTEPLFPGKTYSLLYEDNSSIITIHNGVLESVDMEIDNRLMDYGAKVEVVPGVIQAEQYWFRVGDPVVEVCDDSSELGTESSLGYIGSGDLYTYKVNVPEGKAGKYTVTIRYASQSNGEFNYVLNGKKYHMTLLATKGFNDWQDAFRVIELEEGEQNFEIEIVSGGFNINYFSITDEEKYPISNLVEARVPKTGKTVTITFDSPLDVFPTNSDITLKTEDDKVLEISEISGEGYSITCTLETPIYVNQTVTLSFSSKTAMTLDGGPVNDTTIKVINKSKAEAPAGISAIESADVVISPVPAKVGQPISIATGSENTFAYSIYTVNGGLVSQGEVTEGMEVVIGQKGVYLIVLSDGVNEVTKKIIVQ